MNVDRTDPTRKINYFAFPYVVKPKKWEQTWAKVAAIALHILLSIATFGLFAVFTGIQYISDRNKHRSAPESTRPKSNPGILQAVIQEPSNNTFPSIGKLLESLDLERDILPAERDYQ